MMEVVRIRVDKSATEPDEEPGPCVSYDPDDPASVERARSELSLMLGGRYVPPLCGGFERRYPRRSLRNLFLGSW